MCSFLASLCSACESDRADNVSVSDGGDAGGLGVLVVDVPAPVRPQDAATEDAALDASSADAADPGDSSVNPSDAALDGDAAPEAPAFDGGGVSISGETLTNQPQLAFVDTGEDDLVVVSAFIKLMVAGSFVSLQMFGEIENRGTVARCTLLMNTSLGAQSVLTVVDGPAYTGVGSLSTPCIEPGARGIFRGIQNGVATSVIEDAARLTYEVTGLPASVQEPHPLAPTLLSASRVSTQGYYQVKGELRSGAGEIYNVQLVFYSRDASGLIVDDASAFPLDLETVPPATTLEYESSAFTDIEAEPGSLVHFFEFITGPSPTSSLLANRVVDEPPVPAEVGLRQRVRSERSVAYAAQRRALGPR